jgi:hypothetical protein
MPVWCPTVERPRRVRHSDPETRDVTRTAVYAGHPHCPHILVFLVLLFFKREQQP